MRNGCWLFIWAGQPSFRLWDGQGWQTFPRHDRIEAPRHRLLRGSLSEPNVGALVHANSVQL
ncbi:MAG TPA: hypothetical protein VHC19_04870 [Pirellulales bacterium]|nr:hypothetical protein [Pirellulales bacterium]